MERYLVESWGNEEMILDAPFCVDIYIRYGCDILKVWIQQICNAVIELESVPKLLELDIVTMYKGGGRYPSEINSYQGINLISVIANLRFSNSETTSSCNDGKGTTPPQSNCLSKDNFLC